jgi:queuine tRNA-ribosyltransferase
MPFQDNTMKFDVKTNCPHTSARTGAITLRGQAIETPVFMPVGTAASVKGVRPEEVWGVGARIVLCNTYHLHLRPGEEIIAGQRGLHHFMAWEGGILTDSGGYQIFSLADLVSIDDDGVEFKSHLNGDRIRLDPEGVMKIQARLGSDIQMVLDQCVQYPAPREDVSPAVERTARWAERGLKAHRALQSGSSLFGIIQGGVFKDLREMSARQITGMDFSGFAIGGVSVGEGKALMRDVLDCTAPLLPAEKPRYLMGVGEPDDILDAVAMGIDMFDCVLPTRNARNGTLFTRNGQIKLRNAALKDDARPPDPECLCPLCRSFSRAYVRHLFNAGEMLGPILATLHNLHFYQELMSDIRKAIEEGTFPEFRKEYLMRSTKDQG